MKKVIWLVLLLVTVGVTLGIYQYNRAPKKVEDATAEQITADELYSAFAADETSANSKYLNKVLEVSGTVQEVSVNQDGLTVAVLSADDPMSGVQCTMRERGVKLTIGQKVRVKGFCNGYTLTVILSDCIVTQ